MSRDCATTVQPGRQIERKHQATGTAADECAEFTPSLFSLSDRAASFSVDVCRENGDLAIKDFFSSVQLITCPIRAN